MKRTEILKTIIYQLIGENIFLLDSINGIKRKENWNNLEIDIIHNRDSSGSHKDGKINLGIPDIVDSYKLSLEYSEIIANCENFHLETKYSDFGNNDSIRNKINVFIPSAEQTLIYNELENTDFLKGDKPSVCDTLAIYSLAYSLCHELGHVVHDYYIPNSEQLTRERIADTFAFEAIKYMCGNKKEEQNRLIGAIIGISQVLFYGTPQAEMDDKVHPHSIDRLFCLLDFWGIPDDSDYWKFAHEVVSKWCKKNSLFITWERTASISPKDKFTDAYIHFRKSIQS